MSNPRRFDIRSRHLTVKTLGFLLLAVLALSPCALARPEPVRVFDINKIGETAQDDEAIGVGAPKNVDKEKPGYVFEGFPMLTNGIVSAMGASLMVSDDDGGMLGRGQLRPVSEKGGKALPLTRTELRKAGRGGAEVLTTWGEGRQAAKLALSLRRGESMICVTPEANADRLRLTFEAPLIVLPSFAGDDFLFVPGEFGEGRHFLPSENLLLIPTGDGDTMLQAIWPIGEQEVNVVVSKNDEGPAVIEAIEIAFDDKPIYISAWRHENLWTMGRVDKWFGPKADNGAPEKTLTWTRPFRAEWRAVFHGEGVDTTWDFQSRKKQGTIGMHGGRSKTYVCPAWFEDDAAKLRLPPQGYQTAPAELFVIYALQRTRRTPHTAQLPEDVLRQALGSGPCEYLLDLEGLKTQGRPGGPLCVLDRRFRILSETYRDAPAGRSMQYAEVHVDWMLDQGMQQYGRIQDYERFGREVVELCRQTAADNPKLSPSLEPFATDASTIVTLCETMIRDMRTRADAFTDVTLEADDIPGIMKELAGELKGSLDDRTPENLARWEHLQTCLDRIARYPQGGLPDPRRLTRKMQYQAARLATQGPRAAQLGKVIRRLAGDTLRGKHWAEMGR